MEDGTPNLALLFLTIIHDLVIFKARVKEGRVTS